MCVCTRFCIISSILWASTHGDRSSRKRLKAVKVARKVIQIKGQEVPRRKVMVSQKTIARVTPAANLKNHTTDACFFNARANPKGDGKTNKRASAQQPSTEAAVDAAVPDKNLSAAISTLQTQLDALRSFANPSMPSGHSQGRKGHGAIQEMLFVISDTPAQAVEVTEQVAATSSTKYVLLDSGATTSCASDQCFPDATVDATRQKELWAISGPSMARPFDTRVNCPPPRPFP